MGNGRKSAIVESCLCGDGEISGEGLERIKQRKRTQNVRIIKEIITIILAYNRKMHYNMRIIKEYRKIYVRIINETMVKDVRRCVWY